MRRLIPPFVLTVTAPACAGSPGAADTPPRAHVPYSATLQRHDGGCLYTESGSCPPPEQGTCNPPPPVPVLCPQGMGAPGGAAPPPAPAGKEGWLYSPPPEGVHASMFGECTLFIEGGWCPPVEKGGPCTPPKTLSPTCVRPSLKGGPSGPSDGQLAGVPPAPQGEEGFVYVKPFTYRDASGACVASEAIWCDPGGRCPLATRPAEGCDQRP